MFQDRFDAARQLAARLEAYKNNKDVIILAIPRGALEIGSVLSKELNAPLDVIFTKKIGAPGNPELAIGTVSMNQVLLSPEYKDNQDLQEYVEGQVSEIRELLSKRIERYRAGKPPLDVKDKIVIIVDDGVATGHTLKLALQLVKDQKPKKILVAVPVGPKHTIDRLKKQVDEVICLLEPTGFMAIGQFYQRFPQVDDETAIELLKKANA